MLAPPLQAESPAALPRLTARACEVPSLEDPLVLAERAPVDEPLVFWEQPSRGETLLGIGAVETVTPRGEQRFAAAARDCRRLLQRVSWSGPDEGAPRLIGGFAFAGGGEQDTRWAAFPDTHFLLPQIQIVRSSHRTYLTSIEAPSELRGLQSAIRDPQSATPLYRFSIEAEPGPWRDAVASVVESIRARREAEKVVLTRTCTVDADEPFDCARLVRRLRARYPTCTVFWVRRDGGSFIGATPERLAAVRDGWVRTHAVAGTAARSDGSALLECSKIQDEHAYVVRAISAGLRPFCHSLAVPTRPERFRLPDLDHLVTPFLGRLHHGIGLLDLVGALHPSPAVAGHPRDAALDLIAQHERFDRGWYTGPIGWVNRDGEGELAVALRCALVRESTATLFAGAGIVADSDPDTELEETRHKLQAMLSALLEI